MFSLVSSLYYEEVINPKDGYMRRYVELAEGVIAEELEKKVDS